MSSSVDWSAGKMLPYGNGQRMLYPVTCGKCKRVRHLRKRDAAYVEQHESPCYLCSQKIKAEKGYAAAEARYGQKWIVPKMQVTLRQNRTPQEATIEAWLTEQGIPFVSEELIRTRSRGRKQRCYLIDIMVRWKGEQWAIEVNGGCHDAPSKQVKDKRKLRYLRYRQIPYMVLRNEEVDDGSFIDRLTNWLMGEG